MFTDSKLANELVNITVSIGTNAGCHSANLAGLAQRFWAKVRRGGDGECWLWAASTTGSGLPYGQFALPREGGRQGHCYAHRMAWLLTHGAIPDGLKVCHRCDVPTCCNPKHLFLGTQAENLADCRAKHRMPSVRRGKKLSIAARASIVSQLRAGARQVDLAAAHGVSKSIICRLAAQGRHARTVAALVPSQSPKHLGGAL